MWKARGGTEGGVGGGDGLLSGNVHARQSVSIGPSHEAHEGWHARHVLVRWLLTTACIPDGQLSTHSDPSNARPGTHEVQLCALLAQVWQFVLHDWHSPRANCAGSHPTVGLVASAPGWPVIETEAIENEEARRNRNPVPSVVVLVTSDTPYHVWRATCDGKVTVISASGIQLLTVISPTKVSAVEEACACQVSVGQADCATGNRV